MNELIQNYTVRELDVVLKADHTKLYIVFDKDRYVAIVMVNLLSTNHEFTIVDEPNVDSEIIRVTNGYYYENSLAIEAVARHVLAPIEKRHKAVEHPYY